MKPSQELPQYHELLWPAVKAVFELGGSASINEMVETVVKQQGFTDEQQSVPHNDGPGTEIGYRLAWGRTYLKGMDCSPTVHVACGLSPTMVWRS